jgi:heme-degrading monooxygenase HmoA
LGCLSEHLLCSDSNRGEFISYSEWDSAANIDRCRQSNAHREIKDHRSVLRDIKVT